MTTWTYYSQDLFKEYLELYWENNPAIKDKVIEFQDFKSLSYHEHWVRLFVGNDLDSLSIRNAEEPEFVKEFKKTLSSLQGAPITLDKEKTVQIGTWSPVFGIHTINIPEIEDSSYRKYYIEGILYGFNEKYKGGGKYSNLSDIMFSIMSTTINENSLGCWVYKNGEDISITPKDNWGKYCRFRVWDKEELVKALNDVDMPELAKLEEKLTNEDIRNYVAANFNSLEKWGHLEKIVGDDYKF